MSRFLLTAAFVEDPLRCAGDAAAVATFGRLGVLFDGTWEETPDWVYDPTWNLMRLTARGLDDPGAIFEVQVDYRALHIFLR